MSYEFYQNLPQYVDLIALMLGSFSVRWYAVSYLAGFAVVYLVLLWRIKKGEFRDAAQICNLQFPISKQTQSVKKNSDLEMRNITFDLLLVAFFSALIGGRIGYVLFYGAEYFFANPLAIISPYDQNGNFTGLYGMSYHGAILGVIGGSFLFLKIKKQNFLAWADFMIPAVPLGYFFGRIGNFLNGELYGRITSSPLGMYFSMDRNNLRHPSQLYEALLEGLLLFAFLWKMRNKKMQKGSLFAMYLFGYGSLRILAEQFRQPDAQIGFLWGVLTLGQILSLLMMLAGAMLFFSLSKKEK